MTNREIKLAIERFEYFNCQMHRISCAWVRVVNVRQRKLEAIADVITCFGEGEPVTRMNNERYSFDLLSEHTGG